MGGADAKIVVHARDDKSGTYDSFKQMVLGKSALSGAAQRHEASDKLSDAVAGDSLAIGFVGLAYVRSAKPVMVQDATSVPLLPSPLTVSTEDYPLARRLYVYAPSAMQEDAKSFVDFVTSDEGQAVVRRTGFVDLQPECDARAQKCTTCTAEYRAAVAGACRLTMNVRFDAATGQLDTRALRDLQRLPKLLEAAPFAGKSLMLFGFEGGADRVKALGASRERAETVAAQLRARGLDVFAVKGFGAEMPVANDATDEGREKNRRVEIWLR